MRRRVFRPRLVDGVPVDAENLRLVHTFSYLKSDLDTLRAASAQSTEGNPAPDEEQADEESAGKELQDADSD